MKYYLMEVTTYTDKETEEKALYAYDTYNEALSPFHTKMGGLMKRENTNSELLVIIDDYGNVMRSEKYVKPAPEPTPEVIDVSEEVPVEE